MRLSRHRRAGWLLALLLLPTAAAAHDGRAERLAALDAIVREEPGAAGPLIQRAELHRAARDFRAAAADLERARRLGADDRTLALAAARLHRDARLPDLAWDDLRPLVAREDARREELELAADVLHALGRTRAALPLLERALAGDPAAGPDLWLRRARWTEKCGAGEIEHDGAVRALAVLDAALERLGPCVALELEALRIEEELGLAAAALVRLERLDPGPTHDEVWLARRGDLLAVLGRPAAARAAYARALARLRERPPRRRAQASTLALERTLRAKLDAHAREDREAPDPDPDDVTLLPGPETIPRR